MSSSYTKDKDTTIDSCEQLGDFPLICGQAQSDGGSQDLSVKVCIDLESQMVDIQMIGPDNVWFGVGFDGIDMDNTYSIVVHGDNLTETDEFILTQYSRGIPAPFDGENGVSIINSKTENGIKTVNIARDRISDQNGVFSFPSYPTTINVIFGKGRETAYQGAMGGHSKGGVRLDLAIVTPTSAPS